MLKAPQKQPQLLLSGFGGEDHVSPTEVLDEAAVENADDDYWDVESDDDMLDIDTVNNEDALLASSEFSNIRRIHYENFNELGVRRYDAFLYDGLLSQYRPEYAASPLRNPKTARVFAHYIHVVSQTRSLVLVGRLVPLGIAKQAESTLKVVSDRFTKIYSSQN